MQSSLKKSLYLGLAALSFASVAAVSTTASAKSYAKAGAYTVLKADATKRNVEATGTNALYTKPGTVKGAKVVASKKVMSTLATSKKSANYFRAYGQKVTNRGSVYYRVVTMDGKYRGYVYGGKTEGTFAGGVKSATTTTDATKPTKTTGYYLKDTTKNTIWTAPKYTQYKAKKVSLYGAKSTDTFTVDNAQTKTREGSLYYHVTDDNNSAITGWIYAGKGYDASITDNTKQDLGGLALNATDATATENNSVTVNYVDATSGNSVAKSTFVTKDNDTKAGQDATTTTNANSKTLAQFATADLPANYKLTDVASGANYVAADNAVTSVTGVKYGDTLNVKVYKSATSKVSFYVQTANGLNAGTQLKSSDLQGGFPALSTTAQKVLTGADNTPITLTDIDGLFTQTTATDATFTSTQKTISDLTAKYFDNTADAAAGTETTTTPKVGDNYYVAYVYNKTATTNANDGAKYGTTVKAVFTPYNVLGTVPGATNNSSSNNNYAE